MTFLAVVSILTTHISPRHLSSVLSKFSHKNKFHSDVTPGWRHPGRSTPSPRPRPSDATDEKTRQQLSV